jgi:DNA-binding NarL/FixJ family response regulator
MNTLPRVLVVDDDDVFRSTLLALLERQGFRTDGAANLVEAKAAVDQRVYHVVIIDIMLEGDDNSNRDGVEVLRYLRRLGNDTKSLVLSGQSDTTLVRDLFQECGADGYLTKRELATNGTMFLLQIIRELINEYESCHVGD